MGFSWQEYCNGSPFLSPEDLPDPGIKPGSPALQADSLLFELGECDQGILLVEPMGGDFDHLREVREDSPGLKRNES